jgi:hypothetical protein
MAWSEKTKAIARAICRVQLNGGDPDQPAVRWNGTEMEPQEFPVWRDFLDEANAPSTQPPLLMAMRSRRVRHKKRGTTYCVLGYGELQSSTPIKEGAALVVYQCETDGRIWVRPAAEFEDGRFEIIERARLK